jgi:hypothetical protein
MHSYGSIYSCSKTTSEKPALTWVKRTILTECGIIQSFEKQVASLRFTDLGGVPGAIAGKFTVSWTTQEFVLMVTRLFISKNKAFEACCGI